ncbi:hypothetical protein I317_03811 [Kwoniella heveanensis CBS 569]|nr:hypothetical protein I317_03811 [Kwoniella heveanensis CBS 569]
MSSRLPDTEGSDGDKGGGPGKRARHDFQVPNQAQTTRASSAAGPALGARSPSSMPELPPQTAANDPSTSWAHLRPMYSFSPPNPMGALPPLSTTDVHRPSPSQAQVLHASSPLSQQLTQVTTPRSMATGHGSAYLTAMSDLLTRVCGDRGMREEANEQLLRTYFAWQGPQHMPVDEALFRRDMASNPTGPYFSRLLLHAIHAQASRHILSRDDGWAYADKANALVMASLAEPPSIPTIQALLILSGRDLALGLASAGWLKSGMAFRMIEDLGIQADVSQDLAMVPSPKLEEVGMRQRLFWSAYSWDKVPRTTTRMCVRLKNADTSSTSLVIDLSPWQPFFPDEAVPSYPAQPAYAGETFYALCLLNIELEQIVQRLYDPAIRENPIDQVSIINNLKLRLLEWRNKVVAQILLDASYLPPFCPPQHILTLNLLYRTAWILLQRPLIRYENTHNEARQACVAKSTEIHMLFKLHDKTFNLRNITYIMAYMAYVSATIDVTEAVSLDPRGSRAVTPTTAHPSGNVNHVNPGEPSMIGNTTSQHIDTHNVNLFGDMPLAVGFEELFATLLPEYSLDSLLPQSSLNGESTAFLPMMDDDWFRNL